MNTSPSLTQALDVAREALVDGAANGINILFGQAGKQAQQPYPAPTVTTAAPGVPASAPIGAGSAGSSTDPNKMDTNMMIMYGIAAVVIVAAVVYVVRRG
jgi:hypothetical protein